MRLKELRIAQKLYQKDIADILGVDRTTYTKYESGASEPDIATLIQLADFFGVTVDYLISHEENVVSEMSTMEINTIGKRIKGIRERQNLSLDDLAEKLNMSPHQLFCYEYNMATPDEQTIERIAKILKINKSCLLGSWEKDVLDDFYADLRKHPERWTDKHIMEIFETEGVPYELQSLYYLPGATSQRMIAQTLIPISFLRLYPTSLAKILSVFCNHLLLLQNKNNL